MLSKICDSPKNSIIAENCLPGNDSTEWDVNADGDPSIQVDFQYHCLFLWPSSRDLLQNSVWSREISSSSRSKQILQTTVWTSSALAGLQMIVSRLQLRLPLLLCNRYEGAGARQVARVDPLPSLQLPQVLQQTI